MNPALSVSRLALPYLIPTGKPELSGRNNWKRAASQGILALSMSLGIAAFRTNSMLSKRLCYYGYIESNRIDGCSSSKIVHPPRFITHLKDRGPRLVYYGPSQPLMNVGVVGLQEPRISVTLYISETYLLSATQTPTQRSDRS